MSLFQDSWSTFAQRLHNRREISSPAKNKNAGRETGDGDKAARRRGKVKASQS